MLILNKKTILKKTIIFSAAASLLLAPFSFSPKNINFTEAATVVSSNKITENTIWTLSGSPYIVNETIIIQEGATLTIEPGVIVKFEQTGLIVRGELSATGAKENPVVFTSIHDNARGGQSAPWSSGNPAPGDWGAIKIEPNGQANLNYAVINYGGNGAVYLLDNRGARSIIRQNTANAQSSFSIGAVTVFGGAAEIRDSEIAHNKIGILTEFSSVISISSSKIYDNTEAGIIAYSAETPVYAANNWWGDDSGPYESTLNPDGKGDKVDGNVIFEPWIGQSEEEQGANPVLTYSRETNYQTDGVDPNKGTAKSTKLTFKVIYTDEDNDAPESVNVVIGDNAATITSPLALDADAAPELRDNDFTNGEQYTVVFTFPKGKYAYYFTASDGKNTVRLPETGALAFETGYSNVAFLPGFKRAGCIKKE